MLQLPGATAGDLVVDGLRGQVHEGEVVRSFTGLDVLVRDRVDVRLDVLGGATREHTLLVVLGVEHAVDVAERALASTGSSFSAPTTASTRSPLASRTAARRRSP